ncbi:hypothetical protein A1O1_03934 [Capronia coronata CBS 617.96]|uniref:nitrilase n=1 Tax=Capronia coronata CBS 617.96 TaxID=1182541 RepID=W9Z8K9_9EURO|nr:uncharacterized protein A1O1_03934 [Capronia coronata CBS 617.96]EXJ90829.1 hypothetical protein A1O1_03934 [Capronia coronata CBS 617.96]
MSIRQWKAAVCQTEPCWLDKTAGVAKTIQLIREAKENCAALIAFSETWLPGYPLFLWSNAYMDNLSLVQRYIQNSITAQGPEMLAIRRTAAECQMYVSLGFSERDGASLYIAQVLIGPDGNVLLHRRKLKPTHVERTIFGDATGDSVNSVVATPLGKIGMLNCWEHLQPLLKYHAYSQGEEVHIAAWPNNRVECTAEPWTLSMQASVLMASQFYALEGQTFVLAANYPITQEGRDKNTPETTDKTKTWKRAVGGGAASVYGPDGRRLTEPTDHQYDGLIYCDIDLDKIYEAKTLADPVGHYSRPDLLRLLVDDQPKNHVVRLNEMGTPLPARTLLSQHRPLDALLEAKDS